MIVSSNLWAASRTSETQASQSAARAAPPQGPPPNGPPPAGAPQAASEGISMSDETLAGLVSAQQAQGEGFAPPAFEDIDADEDGGISQAELQAFGQSVHGEESTEKADGLFAAMDADGDGTVTAEEKSAFDDSRSTAMGPPPGGSPPQATQATDSESDTTGKLAALMQELMTALEAYSGTAQAQTETTGTTTSVAA